MHLAISNKANSFIYTALNTPWHQIYQILDGPLKPVLPGRQDNPSHFQVGFRTFIRYFSSFHYHQEIFDRVQIGEKAVHSRRGMHEVPQGAVFCSQTRIFVSQNVRIAVVCPQGSRN